MPLFRTAILSLALSAPLTLGAVSTRADESVDFNRDIRPILAANCFKCHGPDATERKGGTKERKLRLDTEAGAFASYDGTIPVVPNNPGKSNMIQRISSTDPDQAMPPMKSGAKRLPPEQIALLTKWISQGAKFAEHWSYARLERPALPAVKDAQWGRNEIDRFVLARLEREGLTPQPEADRYTLIRRASLDVLGLPPSVADVDEFVNDASPNAYERMVDRLLARPAYGEHWARMWLDLARYADSSGYASDTPRMIWAFRDYVINSFNENKPFDQFTIEQIAGDMLPNPTQEQLFATAFHRNTMTNTEGGTTREEFRNAAIIDRVNTTMSVWMGTSFACSQCHNHKYDPLPQKDYFRFFAVLNNTADADKPGEEPLLEFTTDSQEKQKSKLTRDILAIQKKMDSPSQAVLAGQLAWEKKFPLDLQWQTMAPDALKSKNKAKLAVEDDDTIVVANSQKADTYTIEFPLTGGKLTGLQIEALPEKDAKGSAVITSVQATIVPCGCEPNAIAPDAKKPAASKKPALPTITFTSVNADEETAGYDLQAVVHETNAKTKRGKAKTSDPKPGWSVKLGGNKSHWMTLIAAKPVSLPDGARLVLTIEQTGSLGRFAVLATSDARVDEATRTPSNIVQLIANPKRTPKQSGELTRYYVDNIAPEFSKDRQSLATMKKQLAALRPMTVPIMKELAGAERRKSYIQVRGNYLITTDEVTPGVPETFGTLSQPEVTNRLELARWLVDPKNPLTPRVIANRYWEQLFGIGIVRTSEEFGAQGELPSHPELLDYLGSELIRQKWDLKKFVKTLVMSATYRQSSRASAELAARDPENRLLARGPRFRVSAEVIRDQALAVSGLLSPKMLGPSVRPPRPSAGLSAAFGGGLDWEASAGEDRYRRAVYTEARRTSPYPSTATFDAPSREICMLRRARTNTPLQALVTLNDPVYVEAAQALARKMVAAGFNPTDRIIAGFRACVARPPRQQEIDKLTALFDQAKQELCADAKAATELATNPLGPLPKGADPVEMAAWTTVANVMLNLDETLMRK